MKTARTILITGGSRGIGKAIAKAFIENGDHVVLIYQNNQRLAEDVAILDTTGHSFTVQCNIGRRKDILKLYLLLNEKKITINTLVNNAGINKPNDFDKISDKDWDEVLTVNLKGPFMVSQELLPIMASKSNIINISSVSGQYGGPRTSHYAASKAGLISLTQNMAIFCASRGIRVNAIAPGIIESDMAASAKHIGIDDKILLGRLGTAEEVASVALFLASDGASYITAHTINVNGGLYF